MLSSSSLFTAPRSLLRIATAAEQKYITAAMVLAFDHDPMMRWLYPDSHQYLHQFPALMQVAGEPAYAHQTVYAIDGYAGAAFWLPPSVHFSHSALQAHLRRSVFEAQQGVLWAVLEQLQLRQPVVPHWRLSWVAVEPVYQRKGYGSALLRDVLEQCDRHHHPAYVEATQSTHRHFFQRLGFVGLPPVQVGSAPPLFPMIRPPKTPVA